MTDAFRKQFTYYRHLGKGAMDQFSDEELFRDDAARSNSVATIVKHLHGNMLSRWTDFRTTDGEKPWRKRDEEFEVDFTTRAELYARWDEGWGVLEAALAGLTDTDMKTVVYIRNEGHTVFEALARQLAHYAYHVGQIVLLGKQLRGTEWTSLSIPRGASKAFNAGKFAEERGRRHFTDGLLGGGAPAPTDTRKKQ